MKEATAAAPAPQFEKVHIILKESDDQSSILVVPGKFSIHQDAKNGVGQVEWHCASSGFSVDFEAGSPFNKSHYECLGPGSIQSGPAIQCGTFKYKVTIGGNVLDPSGKVDP